MKASSISPINIALVKYWGKRDQSLILPYNSSISITIDGLFTHTTVDFDDSYKNDVFILTSINEGFGRVLVEAMVCGLAIIATRVGGVPEIIHHGENGLLIESRNHQQLAESILYLGQNRQKRQDIGIKNIKSAEFYSLNHYINRVLTIYNNY